MINYCLDEQSEPYNEKLARENPAYYELLSLFFLRSGFLNLIEKKKVGLERAIDIFKLRRQKVIMRRI